MDHNGQIAVDLQIIHTQDGSATLYHPQLNEHYHSTHGALTESRHVFIRHGYHEALAMFQEPLRILEVGFGTGLNAALTAAESHAQKRHTEYTALEPFPVPAELLQRLEYNKRLSADEYGYFEKIHRQPWEIPTAIHEYFSLEKRKTGIQDLGGTNGFGLIYFDAFAPEKQPDMWTLEVLQTVYRLLQPGGMLVTYCAKGQFKRDLKASGFRVEARPGPPGKREITVAIK